MQSGVSSQARKDVRGYCTVQNLALLSFQLFLALTYFKKDNTCNVKKNNLS